MSRKRSHEMKDDDEEKKVQSSDATESSVFELQMILAAVMAAEAAEEEEYEDNFDHLPPYSEFEIRIWQQVLQWRERDRATEMARRVAVIQAAGGTATAADFSAARQTQQQQRSYVHVSRSSVGSSAAEADAAVAAAAGEGSSGGSAVATATAAAPTRDQQTIQQALANGSYRRLPDDWTRTARYQAAYDALKISRTPCRCGRSRSLPSLGKACVKSSCSCFTGGFRCGPKCGCAKAAAYSDTVCAIVLASDFIHLMQLDVMKRAPQPRHDRQYTPAQRERRRVRQKKNRAKKRERDWLSEHHALRLHRLMINPDEFDDDDPFESNEILPEVAPLVPPQARPFQRLSSKLHPATAADVDMTEEDEQSPQYALVDENEDDMIEGGQDDLFGNNDVEADDEEDEEEVVDLTSAMVLDALIDRIKLQRGPILPRTPSPTLDSPSPSANESSHQSSQNLVDGQSSTLNQHQPAASPSPSPSTHRQSFNLSQLSAAAALAALNDPSNPNRVSTAASPKPVIDQAVLDLFSRSPPVHQHVYGKRHSTRRSKRLAHQQESDENKSDRPYEESMNARNELAALRQKIASSIIPSPHFSQLHRSSSTVGSTRVYPSPAAPAAAAAAASTSDAYDDSDDNDDEDELDIETRSNLEPSQLAQYVQDDHMRVYAYSIQAGLQAAAVDPQEDDFDFLVSQQSVMNSLSDRSSVSIPPPLLASSIPAGVPKERSYSPSAAKLLKSLLSTEKKSTKSQSGAAAAASHSSRHSRSGRSHPEIHSRHFIDAVSFGLVPHFPHGLPNSDGLSCWWNTLFITIHGVFMDLQFPRNSNRGLGLTNVKVRQCWSKLVGLLLIPEVDVFALDEASGNLRQALGNRHPEMENTFEFTENIEKQEDVSEALNILLIGELTNGVYNPNSQLPVCTQFISSTVVHCLCGRDEAHQEDYHIFPVSLPHEYEDDSDVLDLQSLVHRTLFPQLSEDIHRCSDCNQEGTTSSRNRFISGPQILILSLELFEKCWHGPTMFLNKTTRTVHVPLTLRLPIGASACVHYDLVATMNHIGDSIEEGHCLAMIRNHERPDFWEVYNDLQLRFLTNGERQKSKYGSPYVLVFRRKDSDVSSEDTNIYLSSLDASIVARQADVDEQIVRWVNDLSSADLPPSTPLSSTPVVATPSHELDGEGAEESKQAPIADAPMIEQPLPVVTITAAPVVDEAVSMELDDGRPSPSPAIAVVVENSAAVAVATTTIDQPAAAHENVEMTDAPPSIQSASAPSLATTATAVAAAVATAAEFLTEVQQQWQQQYQQQQQLVLAARQRRQRAEYELSERIRLQQPLIELNPTPPPSSPSPSPPPLVLPPSMMTMNPTQPLPQPTVRSLPRNFVMSHPLTTSPSPPPPPGPLIGAFDHMSTGPVGPDLPHVPYPLRNVHSDVDFVSDDRRLIDERLASYVNRLDDVRSRIRDLLFDHPWRSDTDNTAILLDDLEYACRLWNLIAPYCENPRQIPTHARIFPADENQRLIFFRRLLEREFDIVSHAFMGENSYPKDPADNRSQSWACLLFGAIMEARRPSGYFPSVRPEADDPVPLSGLWIRPRSGRVASYSPLQWERIYKHHRDRDISLLPVSRADMLFLPLAKCFKSPYQMRSRYGLLKKNERNQDRPPCDISLKAIKRMTKYNYYCQLDTPFSKLFDALGRILAPGSPSEETIDSQSSIVVMQLLELWSIMIRRDLFYLHVIDDLPLMSGLHEIMNTRNPHTKNIDVENIHHYSFVALLIIVTCVVGKWTHYIPGLQQIRVRDFWTAVRENIRRARHRIFQHPENSWPLEGGFMRGVTTHSYHFMTNLMNFLRDRLGAALNTTFL